MRYDCHCEEGYEDGCGDCPELDVRQPRHLDVDYAWPSWAGQGEGVTDREDDARAAKKTENTQ